jgi:hypothetical protein
VWDALVRTAERVGSKALGVIKVAAGAAKGVFSIPVGVVATAVDIACNLPSYEDDPVMG